jgi:hypothetical protein
MKELFLISPHLHEPVRKWYCFENIDDDTLQETTLEEVIKIVSMNTRLITHDYYLNAHLHSLSVSVKEIVDLSILNKILFPTLKFSKEPFFNVSKISKIIKPQANYKNIFRTKFLAMKLAPFFQVELARYLDVEAKLLKTITSGPKLTLKFNEVNLQKRLAFIRSPSEIIHLEFALHPTFKSQAAQFSILKNLMNCNFAYYDLFGTKTGRIFLRNPCVQFLKKEYRKELFNVETTVEPDYSSFEPTILAIKSQNTKLYEYIITDELYDRVSSLIGQPNDRECGKLAFICLMYGISDQNLILLFAESNITITSFDIQKIRSEFSSSWKWIKSFGEEAKRIGHVSSECGNNLIIDNDYYNEKIANHYIQATGSLIFKNALIEIFRKKLENFSLVMPLHDGALFYTDNRLLHGALLKDIFELNFKKTMKEDPLVKIK